MEGPAAPSTNPSDSPPIPPPLVRSKSFTASLQEIGSELFNLCDKNRNGYLERDEYRKVTKRVFSLFLPNVRARWEWKEMDADKDGKVSLNEWLSGTEAIADFAGEEEFLKAILKWGKLEKSNKLVNLTTSEMARKKATGEPFEAPDSAKLKPPFSVTKETQGEKLELPSNSGTWERDAGHASAPVACWLYFNETDRTDPERLVAVPSGNFRDHVPTLPLPEECEDD